MVTACEDVIDELETDSAVAALVDGRIFGGAVPPGTAVPFIWVQRRAIAYCGSLVAEETPLWEYLDLECVSNNASEAVEVADAVRACLHGRSGTVGDTLYSFIHVADQAETYVPRNVDAGENLFVSSLSVEVTRP